MDGAVLEPAVGAPEAGATPVIVDFPGSAAPAERTSSATTAGQGHVGSATADAGRTTPCHPERSGASREAEGSPAATPQAKAA